MYAGKRFSYKYKIYKTRAFLAAIDYNFHNGRNYARNKKGEKMYVIQLFRNVESVFFFFTITQGIFPFCFCFSSYKRYYNKKSKNWSVYAVKEAKTYAYIPELQRKILQKRIDSGRGLPRKVTLDEDDPEHLGLVNTAETPPPTAELVARHLSRGAVALLSKE